jgi:hypothetical protein
MGSGACARRWQAEAIEDGRLEGAERVSFERHRATCSVCAEEYRVLATVRELSEQLCEDRPTEFERRRLRYEILRQADAIVTAAAPTRRWGQFGLAAAAVTVLAVSATWVVSPREQPRVARNVLPHANVDFPVLPARAWKHDGAVGEQRAEGRVAEDSLGRAEASSPRPRHRGPSGPSGSSARGGADTAGRAFAQAFAAFSSGAYALAEERFLRFETEHPGDTRVEDAAFLRAICRQRRGDQAGAAREADEYLRKFPDGFRRREAEAILVGD